MGFSKSGAPVRQEALVSSADDTAKKAAAVQDGRIKVIESDALEEEEDGEEGQH